MRICKILAAVAVSSVLPVSAFAGDGGGFSFNSYGFNFGNWANGTAAANGTANLENGNSVDNTSSTLTAATLGPCCANNSPISATEMSSAQNNITVVGGSSSVQSTTAAYSQAGVGNGIGGASVHAGH